MKSKKTLLAIPISLMLTLMFSMAAFDIPFSKASAQGPVCVSAPANLVSWWPGDGDATDIVGNNDGLLQGDATFAAAKVGQGFSFDGNGDFVEVPDDPSLDAGIGDFSIDAWVQLGTSTGVQTIVDKRTQPTPGAFFGYAFFTSSGNLGVQLADGTPTNFISAANVGDGMLHLVAVTVERDSATGGVLYVDGTPVLTFDPTARSGSLDNDSDFFIGKNSPTTGADNFLTGIIDELEFFNRALTAMEILDIFNADTAGKCKAVCEGIICPADITQSNDPGQCGAVVNYPAPTPVGTGCGPVICNPASGSFFPVGTTTVTCTVTTGAPLTNFNGVSCAGGGIPQTITHSLSQAVTPLNSVSCNNGIGHTDNSYWRAFDLNAFGIMSNFDIESVEIGIEEATSGGGAGVSQPPRVSGNVSKKPGGQPQGGSGQPLTVNLYTSSMPFPTGFPGSLTLIGTTSITVADQALTIVTIPVTGTAPAGSELVVEIFTPDGQVAGNLFFIGSNAAGQTGPSYLSAAACGVATPTPTGSVGFPNMHIVMNVNGCQQVATGLTCTFNVTVNDTEPPVITCPANIITGTAAPGDTCVPVNFTVTATDNCPGVTVACVDGLGNPVMSGDCIPATATCTAITCTATDAAGNTATCNFTVAVFDVFLEDDGNTGTRELVWNSFTGDYIFCCDGLVLCGTGTATRKGNIYALKHTPFDRRVNATFNASTRRGTGSLQFPAGNNACSIEDRNTLNNFFDCAAIATCTCGNGIPAASGKK